MASREEKLAELRRLDKIAQLRAMDAAPAKKPKDKDSGFTDFREGLAESGIRTYLGVKDLMGLAKPWEKESLADLSSDASESGWGTAGNVVGEVAQLAVPGGAAVRVAKGARLLPLAADIAASTAHGAVRLPKAGETRGSNALASGTGAVAGAGLAKSLSLLGKGLPLTPEATRLRDLGVEITPGQGIPFFKRAEDIAEVTPFFARATKKLKAASQETAHQAALKQAAPPGMSVTKTGHEGVNELRKAYDQAYTAAWGPANNLAPNAVPRALTVGSQGTRGLGKKDTATIRRVQDDIVKLVQGDPNVSGKKIDEVIRKAKGNTKKSIRVDEALTDMRKTLRAGLPADSQKALSAIDAQYPKYLVVKHAAKTKSAMGDKGHFDPSDLITGVKSIGGDRAGYGAAPMQGFADDVMATVGQKPGPQPLSWWRRMSDITPTIGPQKTLAKAITGQAKGQKVLRKALESQAAKKLRYGVSGARLGAALEQDEEEE